MSAPTLLTERLILRPVKASDLTAMATIRADEKVGQYTGGVRSVRDTWFTMLRSGGLWDMLGYGYWIVTTRTDNTPIGEIGFADFKRGIEPDISGDPEAGWIIAPSHWGQGLASEGVGAAHDWLDKTKPGRSTCIISPDNTASIRIAERFGYKEIALTDTDGDPILVFERFTPGTRKG